MWCRKCDLMGIQHQRTTRYRLERNGHSERVNNKTDDGKVAQQQFSALDTHQATCFTPFLLHTGREPHMGIQNMLHDGIANSWIILYMQLRLNHPCSEERVHVSDIQHCDTVMLLVEDPGTHTHTGIQAILLAPIPTCYHKVRTYMLPRNTQLELWCFSIRCITRPAVYNFDH